MDCCRCYFFVVVALVDINNSNVITLGDCLTLFTEPEVLHPDQTWYCPKCKVHCQATKELSLWRLPPTLIIHLKRFSFVGMLWRNKIDDLVDFPVTLVILTLLEWKGCSQTRLVYIIIGLLLLVFIFVIIQQLTGCYELQGEIIDLPVYII